MADANRKDSSARLKRNVSKMAFRSREKVLRTFGRADETKDEIIDNYVHLVGKQQNQFQKFQRDVKTYLTSINVMRNAAKAFYVSLDEVYENDWIGKDVIQQLAKTTDLLYNDLYTRLNTEVISTLQDHLNACNDMKVKVGKRGRKLVDFDASRRNYETLQSSKKLEESKLTKARDHVSQAHETYETMNNTLHDELPDLHDSRVVLCADVVHMIAVAEKDFYMELSEVRTKLLNVLASVKDAYEGGDYRIQRLHSPLSDPVARKDKVEQATLPADDVTGQSRSRGHSSPSERRSSNSSHHRHNDSSRSHDSHKRRDSKEKKSHRTSETEAHSHQYVNLEIGGKLTNDVEEEPDPMTNGQSEHEYSSVAVEEDVKAGALKPTGQKPTPSPRMSFKNNPTPGGSKDLPQPLPRTLVVEEQSPEDQSSEKASKGQSKGEMATEVPEKTSVKRRNKKEAKPEPNTEKRKSFFGFMSTFSKPSKSENLQTTNKPIEKNKKFNTLPATMSKATEKEESKKKGFFGRRKRQKTASDVDLNTNPQNLKIETTEINVQGDTVKDNSPSQDANKTLEGLSKSENGERLHADSFAKVEIENNNENAYENIGQLGQIEKSEKQPDEQNQSETDKPFQDVSVAKVEPAKSSNYENVEGFKDNKNQKNVEKISDLDDDCVNLKNRVSNSDNDNKDLKNNNDTHKNSEKGKESDVTDSDFGHDSDVSEFSSTKKDGGKNIGPNLEGVVVLDGFNGSEYGDDDSIVSEDFKQYEPETSAQNLEINSLEKGKPAVQITQELSKDNSRTVDASLVLNIDNDLMSENYKLKANGAPPDDQSLNDQINAHNSVPDSFALSLKNKEKVLDDQESLTDEDVSLDEELNPLSDDKSDLVYQPSFLEEPIRTKEEPSVNKLSSSLSYTDSKNLLSVDSADDKAYITDDVSISDADSQKSCSTTSIGSLTKHLPKNIDKQFNKMPVKRLEDVYNVVSFGEDLKKSGKDVKLDSENDRNVLNKNNTGKEKEEIQPLYEEPIKEIKPAVIPPVDTKNEKGDAEKETEIFPTHYLYTAKAMYPYKGGDEDELTFNKNDIIYVVQYPDPDEQDEGWQMGILKSSWTDSQSSAVEGVFPQNFTVKIAE